MSHVVVGFVALSYGHGGMVISPSHTFSWASLNKQLTSTSCTYLACKTPVTPGGVSTALPRSCIIFQSTMRTQENHDIFCEKLSVTASLQQPRRCHGALMAFYSIPTVFMVEIVCALMVLSLHVHGTHSTCAALSWGCHWVEDAVTSSKTLCSLCANATDDHSVCTTTLACTHGAPIVL